MNENELHIAKLITSKIQGTLTEKEQQELDSWLSVSEDRKELLEKLNEESHLREELTYFSSANKASVWNKVQDQLAPGPQRLLWPRIAIAVSVAIIVFSTGLFFFKYYNTSPEIEEVAHAKEIAPGKTGATLTLSNGKKIYITEAASGKLAALSGVVITKTEAGQIVYKVQGTQNGVIAFNTLQTNNGEKIEVILPDQSKVMLNAASTLKYPSDFSTLKQRLVELSGEAYFEVSKDAAHPFVVKTSTQEVRVLGTHFNVKAYADETVTKTTLLEGLVNINHEKLLKPGQLAVNHAGLLRVMPANIEIETAWVNNDFYFEEEKTENVMRDISRWYNISINYADDDLKMIPLSGHISRTRNLSTVLERIGKAANLQFKTTGRNVTVEQYTNQVPSP